jgi:hypothetical protein
MRGTRRCSGLLVTLILLVPAFAQQSGNLAEIHINRIKPSMTQQYEAGRKKHMGWHKNQNDTWSWYTWQVLTGEGTGSYVVGSFQHDWKDLDGRDKFRQMDSADAVASMGASLGGEMESFYAYRPDLSLSPQTSSPAPMASITHFMLNPDGVNDFTEGIKKVNEGIKKTNFPQAGASRWYQLMNGGQAPHFVLAGDRANWAAFQPPTDKTLDAMMEEAYGKDQGTAILGSLRKAIHSVSTEALQYRPDLSYVAPSK